MGLRCLIGHDYGEPQTARDRRERGNEVVVTVTEYRECARCGHTRVLSENKEVKAGGGSPAEAKGDASTAREPEGTDEPDQATVEAFSRSSAEPAGVEHGEPMSAADDDGVILEDEPEAPPRAPGEWPDADVGGASEAPQEEPDPWPDEAPAPDPEPAEPEEPEPPGPGEDPLEVGPEPTASAAADDPEQTEVMTDDRDAEPAADEAEASPPPRPDNRNTEFVCPDCGETWPTRNASLRPGDICPECRSGYLDERVVQ